ncbi:DUF4365 domain-containing protein [Streptomyces sp. NPDC002537]
MNEVRALPERHGHIVQEADGGDDHGEDLHVTFAQDGRRTADSIAVQVKGGVSMRTGSRVRSGRHRQALRFDPIPMIGGVILDGAEAHCSWGASNPRSGGVDRSGGAVRRLPGRR